MAYKNNNQNVDKSSTENIKAVICVPLTVGIGFHCLVVLQALGLILVVHIFLINHSHRGEEVSHEEDHV